MSSPCAQAKQTKKELLCVWGNSQTAAVEWTVAACAVGPHNTMVVFLYYPLVTADSVEAPMPYASYLGCCGVSALLCLFVL